MSMPDLRIRPARIDDKDDIFRLIHTYPDKLVQRTGEYIIERIGNFYVAEYNENVVGCSAFETYGIESEDPEKPDVVLCEIKSLAVNSSYQRQKIGTDLVTRCITWARKEGFKTVFSLTHSDNMDFFSRLKFKRTDRKDFPEKIWLDCKNCPKYEENAADPFARCDEIAVVRYLTPNLKYPS